MSALIQLTQFSLAWNKYNPRASLSEIFKSSILIAVGLIELQIRTDVWIFASLTNSEENKNDSKSALSGDLCLLGVARKSFGRLGTICLGIHLEMSPKFHTDYSLLSFLSLKTTSSQLQRQMFEKDVNGHVVLSSCKQWRFRDMSPFVKIA